MARLLPVFAVLAALLGYSCHTVIAPYKGLMVPILAIIMLCMGLTLSLKDFLTPFKSPLPLFLGITLQFILMPLLAWSISKVMALPEELLIGMILVGTAPGGTTSNVLTFLAGGRLALSIGMTAFSTLASVIVTPWLTAFWLNTVIEVDKIAMLTSIAQLVIIPVFTGIFLRSLFTELVGKMTPFLPGCATLSVATAIGLVAALNAEALATVSIMVIAAVLLHNSVGLLAGYVMARLAGLDQPTAKTIAIEVGTQNTGMAVTLAIKHFTAVAALPGAIFSISQNMLGVLLFKSNESTKSLDAR